MSEPAASPDYGRLVEVCSEIVVAYVVHNTLTPTDVSKLIADVYRAIAGLRIPSEAPSEPELKPAVPIRRSVTPEYLICLDDGKKFKSLKRHLATLGMTPEQYRAKWHLPSDYPMVAANYSETRSALAKSNGLGRNASLPRRNQCAPNDPAHSDLTVTT